MPRDRFAVAAPEPENVRRVPPLRVLELDAPEQSRLDPYSIVVGSVDQLAVAMPSPVSREPTVVWQGQMSGDGTGPHNAYYVRLYTDGSGLCSCPVYYFRGLLRRQRQFHCKHLVRAWAAHSASCAEVSAFNEPRGSTREVPMLGSTRAQQDQVMSNMTGQFELVSKLRWPTSPQSNGPMQRGTL